SMYTSSAEPSQIADAASLHSETPTPTITSSNTRAPTETASPTSSATPTPTTTPSDTRAPTATTSPTSISTATATPSMTPNLLLTTQFITSMQSQTAVALINQQTATQDARLTI